MKLEELVKIHATYGLQTSSKSNFKLRIINENALNMSSKGRNPI